MRTQTFSSGERAMWRDSLDSYANDLRLTLKDRALGDAPLSSDPVEWTVRTLPAAPPCMLRGGYDAPDGAWVRNRTACDSTRPCRRSSRVTWGCGTEAHELGHATGSPRRARGGIGVPRDQGPPLRLAPPREGGDHPDAVPFPGVTDLVFAHGRFEVSEGVRMAMRDNRCRVTVAPSPSGVDGDVITPVARDMVSLQAVYVADTAWRSGRDLYRRPIADAAGTLEGCRWDAGGAVIERVWRRRSC